MNTYNITLENGVLEVSSGHLSKRVVVSSAYYTVRLDIEQILIHGEYPEGDREYITLYANPGHTGLVDNYSADDYSGSVLATTTDSMKQLLAMCSALFDTNTTVPVQAQPVYDEYETGVNIKFDKNGIYGLTTPLSSQQIFLSPSGAKLDAVVYLFWTGEAYPTFDLMPLKKVAGNKVINVAPSDTPSVSGTSLFRLRFLDVETQKVLVEFLGESFNSVIPL